MADAHGEFKIESLSSNLLFTVLVGARGFEPATLTKVDPTQAPLTVRLKPRPKDQLPANRTVFGRVLDPQKRPVPGAKVSINSVTERGGMSFGGQPKGTDPVAVSDSAGEFEIYEARSFDSLGLEIEAPGLARTIFSRATPGGQRQDFILPVGAALFGRIVCDGKPVKGINIGIAGVDRAAGKFTGDFVVGTDAEGLFVLPHLPPDRDYQFYGVLDSLRGVGALPARVVRVGKEGSKTDLGVISLTPGWRVEGEVRVANAKTLPVGSRLILGREGAWDFSIIDLPADGRFDLPNVPGEAVNLSVGMAGYRAAGAPPKLGRLESDRTGLILLMEPGK
jgi:hypothetical protein